MSKIELAKIGGITPETFNFSGRWDDSPPVILFPTCRLGYWIFILRWDRSMKTINAITPTSIRGLRWPSLAMSSTASWITPTGSPASCSSSSRTSLDMVAGPAPRRVRRRSSVHGESSRRRISLMVY